VEEQESVSNGGAAKPYTCNDLYSLRGNVVTVSGELHHGARLTFCWTHNPRSIPSSTTNEIRNFLYEFQNVASFNYLFVQ